MMKTTFNTTTIDGVEIFYREAGAGMSPMQYREKFNATQPAI
jgi:hypothetical protein